MIKATYTSVFFNLDANQQTQLFFNVKRSPGCLLHRNVCVLEYIYIYIYIYNCLLSIKYTMWLTASFNNEKQKRVFIFATPEGHCLVKKYSYRISMAIFLTDLWSETEVKIYNVHFVATTIIDTYWGILQYLSILVSNIHWCTEYITFTNNVKW